MSPDYDLDAKLTSVAIIDDDFVSAICLEALLKQEGYRCFRALNGPDGRALVKREEPDMVLLDIQMPEENGLETCRLLKADPATADVPVIFLTGAEDLDTKLEGFQAGAQDYITKPYQTAEVLARIQVHIRSRRMMKLLVQAQMAQLEGLARAQQAIMPTPESVPLANFAVFYRPFHAAGGDFYEVLQAGDQVFDYVVADVSGHDADASLVTSALKVLLHQGCSTLSSPLETLRMVNGALRSAFPEHVYLTLAWARLNRNRKTLSTYQAGHPPLLHLEAASGSFRQIGVPGDVLGMFDSIEVEEVVHPVETGDQILLFTDGLIELHDVEGACGRSRGMRRLARVALDNRAMNLPSMVQAIARELVSEAREVADDLLLLGLEV
jgi:sigma-B regulation protein RsbU (phosphoserine phosphatase)